MSDTDTTDQPANSQRADRVQLPPIGTEPDNATLLICAVMRSSDATVAKLGRFVHPEDLDPPASTVYSAALDLAARNMPPSPALIRGELKRRGSTRSVELWLLNAVTAGAEARALRLYAANVVADRLRALYRSLGHALVMGADTEAEVSLPVLAEQAAKQISAMAERLDVLRGES